LDSGVFPNEWKIAKVKPLYKRDIGTIFRIICYLIFKIMGRLIHFLSNNRIFTEAQNGVRKGKCIETAIHSFTGRIQEALDNEPILEYFLSNQNLQCIES
jgi:hypothetical protein